MRLSMTASAFSPAKQGERVQIWTRRGADFTDRFVRIVEGSAAYLRTKR
jgi:hypothetical protein